LKLKNGYFCVCIVIASPHVTQNVKSPKFEYCNNNLGLLVYMITVDLGYWIFVNRNTIKKYQIFAYGNSRTRTKCYKPIQTVISAWAATTVGGIDIGACHESSKAYHGHAYWRQITRALRNWLTDIVGNYVVTFFSACAVCICR